MLPIPSDLLLDEEKKSFSSIFVILLGTLKLRWHRVTYARRVVDTLRAFLYFIERITKMNQRWQSLNFKY